MRHFSCFDPASGRGLLVFSTSGGPDQGPLEPGSIVVEGEFPGDEWWLPPGEVGPVRRPAPLVLPAELRVGAPLDLRHMPPATRVVLVNEAREELAVGVSEVIGFSDPGRYVVRVDPPMPDHFVWREIEVTP